MKGRLSAARWADAGVLIALALYCSSLTCSIQSVFFPFTAPVRAIGRRFLLTAAAEP
jgi:hypothetical protein